MPDIIVSPLGCSNNPVTLNSSDEDLLEKYSGMDPGSYLEGARILLSGKGVRDSYIFRLWPPGMMVMEAVSLRLFGPSHFVAPVFFLVAGLWSFSLALCAMVLRRLSGNKAFPLVLLSVLAFALFRVYLFRTGVVLSESPGTALLAGGALLFALGMSNRSYSFVASGAVLVILATFYRSQVLLIAETFFALLCLSAVIVTGYRLLRHRSSPHLFWQGGLLSMVLYVGAIGGYGFWNGGGFVHNEYFYWQLWNTPKAGTPGPEGAAGFLDIGGGRAVCEIDLQNCASQRAKDPGTTPWTEYRDAVLSTVLHHPMALIAYKTPYFVEFFFARAGYLSGGVYALDIVENGVIAVLTFAAFGLCICFRREMISWLICLILISCWLGSVGPLFLLHFETRYLFLAKAMSVILALAMFAIWFRAHRGRAGGVG